MALEQKTFSNSAEAKAAGNFSRRNRTRAAMDNARGSGTHVELRRAMAKDRQAESAKRTAAQQLEHLDKVLGKGVGAVRERAKLAKRIAQETKTVKAVVKSEKPKSKKS